MISIRKYLETSSSPEPESAPPSAENRTRVRSGLSSEFLAAFKGVLEEMGRSSAGACSATGGELAQQLARICEKLAADVSESSLRQADEAARTSLQEWGRQSARHYQQKADEVKEMLLAMARTAEAVGERDLRCARKIDEVTAQLRCIATLEDISLIRASIQKSAVELKTSIERINSEGKATLDALKEKVTSFQTKLEEAERAASLDALTRLRSRMWVEEQLEQRIAAQTAFCLAILDIDGFKKINDTYGHVVGDEILRQFSTDLRSACRKSDIVSRWGGDEFLVVMDQPLADAEAQMERARGWICGNYTVPGTSAPIRIDVSASVGVAEYASGEKLKQLLKRADAAMYRQKAAERELSKTA